MTARAERPNRRRMPHRAKVFCVNWGHAAPVTRHIVHVYDKHDRLVADPAGPRRMHATIAATADLHLIRTRPDEPSPLLCHECRLRGGTSYYLTERRLGAHLAAHRNAGHDTPEGIKP